jgi:hypothetical protein
VRAGYGIFYDGFTNGGAVRCRRPSARCRGPRRISCPAPDSTWPIPMAAPLPRSAAGISLRRPPCSPCNRECGRRTRRTGISPSSGPSRGTICSTFATSATRARICRVLSKRIPPSMGRASTRTTTTRAAVHHVQLRRRLQLRSVGLIADDSSSTYHALEAAFSRQYAHGLSFLASYWYSKSLDYISTLNVAGSAPTLVAGENDLAQNPFDLAAEHGPSLFDATHRFVFSGSWALPKLADRFAGRGVSLPTAGSSTPSPASPPARRLRSTIAPTSPCRAARPKSAASTPAGPT